MYRVRAEGDTVGNDRACRGSEAASYGTMHGSPGDNHDEVLYKGREVVRGDYLLSPARERFGMLRSSAGVCWLMTPFT